MESTPGRNVVRVATAPETIGQDLALRVPRVEVLLGSGKVYIPGLLDDYIWMAEALLQAFTEASPYLATARELVETALHTL